MSESQFMLIMSVMALLLIIGVSFYLNFDNEEDWQQEARDKYIKQLIKYGKYKGGSDE